MTLTYIYILKNPNVLKIPQYKNPILIFWSDLDFLEKENNECMKKIPFRTVLHNKDKVNCKKSFQNMAMAYFILSRFNELCKLCLHSTNTSRYSENFYLLRRREKKRLFLTVYLLIFCAITISWYFMHLWFWD